MSYVIQNHSAVITELPMHEVVRYMGMRSEAVDDRLISRMSELLPKFLAAVRCSACSMEIPLVIQGTSVDMTVLSAESRNLAVCLEGCSRAILFAATIGAGTERLRRAAEVRLPSDALILDAMGSAAIEWFCDELCSRWEAEYTQYVLRPRFSPGYGDLSLTLQSDLLQVLDAQRRIGLTLSDSLLMFPQKSVTAIVGMKERINKEECV